MTRGWAGKLRARRLVPRKSRRPAQLVIPAKAGIQRGWEGKTQCGGSSPQTHRRTPRFVIPV